MVPDKFCFGSFADPSRTHAGCCNMGWRRAVRSVGQLDFGFPRTLTQIPGSQLNPNLPFSKKHSKCLYVLQNLLL